MRLTQQEQQVICNSINRVDPEARILLFGSRVDDLARGGGIWRYLGSGKRLISKDLVLKRFRVEGPYGSAAEEIRPSRQIERPME